MTRPSHALAIVGLGCRFPGANDPRTLWENVLGRSEQFRTMLDQRLPLSEYYDQNPKVPDVTYGRRAAYIEGFDFDWAGQRIPRSTFESTDIVQWLALDVAMQAIRDSGIALTDELRSRTAVVIGNTLTGEQSRAQVLRLRWPFVRKALRQALDTVSLDEQARRTLESSMESLYKSVFAPVSEDTLQGGLSNTIAGRIANHLDLNGGGFNVDGACSSSLLALITAANHLLTGDADLALVGGVDISLDPMELVGFAKTSALTPDDMKVYDQEANGFIPGEGAGFVILKRLDDALRDRNTVYAVVRGWGVSSDGRGGITAPSAKGQSAAIIRAWERAALKPGDLTFIEGHGTGTKAGDTAELKALQLAFEHFGDAEARTCAVTSLKSLVGHMKAAAGMGGLIKTIAALNQRVVPPTSGVRRASEVFTGSRSLYPAVRGTRHAPDSTLRAGVSAMGFGGINTHVVLESPPSVPETRLAPRVDADALMASQQSTELFCLAANDSAELLTALAALRTRALPLARGELSSLAAEVNRSAGNGVERAALVARDVDALIAAIDQVVESLLGAPLRPLEQRVGPGASWWLGRSQGRPRVGFVFPGQGSQQVDSAHWALRRYPWARELRERFATALDSQAREVFEALYPDERDLPDPERLSRVEDRLRQTQLAQPAICFSSSVYLELLRRLGFEPEVVAGHSLGELSALHAAGVIDTTSLFELALDRGAVMGATDAEGAMASLACDEATARQLIGGLRGVEVANLNSSNQTVVAGVAAGVDQLVEEATKRNLTARRLKVSRAFHSSLMEPATRALAETRFATTQPKPAVVPVLSGLDGRPLTLSDGLLDYARGQLRSPVNFVALARELTSRCDLLIEVGPGGVLSGLINQDHPERCFPVELRGDAWGPLNALLARAFVTGLTPRWDVVYENRLVRALPVFAERQFLDNPCERPLRLAPGLPATASSSPALGALLSTAGLSDAELKTYLAERGSFLLDVVRADLKASRPRQPLATRVEATAVAPAAEPARAESTDLYARLVAMLAARTGFSPDSMKPSSRLLDDLNLDSIKAGEALLEFMKLAGVEGLEVARLSNAPLQEIVDQVAARQGAATGQVAAPDLHELFVSQLSARTGFPANSILPSSKLLDDLNLDSIKATEALLEFVKTSGVGVNVEVTRFSNATVREIVEQLEALRSGGAKPAASSAQPALPFAGRWVREFELTTRALDVPALQPSRQTNLILLADEATDLVHALATRARDAFARVDVQPASQPPRVAPNDAVVFFMPRLALMDWPARVALLDTTFKRLLACGASSLTVVTTRAPYDRGEEPGLSSFLASLKEEHPALRVRVLHVAPADTELATLDAVLAFADAPEPFVAATITAGAATSPTLTPALRGEPRFSSSPSEVWLVTGGARGITLECGLAAAARFGGRFALVGSTSPDATVVRSALARYEALGVQATYFACDLTSAEQVSALTQRIEAELGPVSHVLHGAGRNLTRLFAAGDVRTALQEVLPKVQGLEFLLEALRSSQLKSVVALSSIIGVSGMPGNSWYALANEALDALVAREQRRRPTAVARTVAYSVWGETGMGKELQVVERLSARGVVAIGTAQGTAAFLSAYEGLGTSSTLVVTGPVGGIGAWNALMPSRAPSGGFVEKVVQYVPGVEAVVAATLSLETDGYLADHDFDGSLLFPTVFGLEAMAQAASLLAPASHPEVIGFQDVSLARPIVVAADGTTQLLVHALVREGGAQPTVELSIYLEKTGYREPHFSAVALLGRRVALGTSARTEQTQPLPLDAQRDLYGDLLFQGPRFQRLGSVLELSTEHLVARAVTLPPDGLRAVSGAGWSLGDPYLRDLELQAPQLPLAPDQLLPIRVARIELGEGAHEPAAFVDARITARDGDEVEATVTLLSESGRIIERLTGYRARIVRRRPERPSVADYLDAERFSTRQLEAGLKLLAAKAHTTAPRALLTHDPAMSKAQRAERHVRQAPILQRLAAAHGISEVELSWQASGRPLLQRADGAELGVSLSHDPEYCLYVLSSEQSVGCDIEELRARSFSQWQQLLGKSHSVLFNRLFSLGESMIRSGHRAWGALEVAHKVLGTTEGLELDLVSREGDFYLVTVRGTGLLIATFPIRIPGAAERMVAIGLGKPLELATAAPAA